ncbi:MAG: hypothetical protein A2149_09270 [Candidatus Schekmanbacteria bacterium RBG_16_38_11]|uniref:histidine kinase n=1 Tax=Candidatus Schekmanbacteria bacterium RBG_16_38_11 TaxID=1817880 RepID=A0A1F7RUR8_9BACT|nr:MAG: hypothetical protein A2149_09270 [Candidatus Schekmanbacteria bacterium RBG_16_38_11]
MILWFIMDIEKIQVKILQQIVKIANAKPDLKTRLSKIANLIKDDFNVAVCSIYLADDTRNFLILRATTGLDQSLVDNVQVPIGEGLTGEFAREKKAIASDDPQRIFPKDFLPKKDLQNIKFSISIPLFDEEDFLGVMDLLSTEQNPFDSKTVEFLESIANQVSGIIRNAKIIYEANHSLSELTKLNEIGKALNSASSLDSLLNLIVKTSLELIPARGCILRLLNKETNLLEIKASSGFEEFVRRTPTIELGQSVAGIVGKEKTPLLIHDIRDETSLTPTSRDLPFTSILCVPLISKDEAIGTIGLLDKLKGERIEVGSIFNQKDLRLLATLASQAAIAVERTFYYENMQKLAKEKELKIRELSILHEISNAMRSTTNLNRRLYMVLTAVTIGDGLGFNRAFLLMVNEKANVLQGMMGVGPASAEEAGKIWSGLHKEGKTLTDILLAKIPMDELSKSKVNEIAKSLRVQITPETGILARTVLEKKPFNITNASQDPEVSKDIAAKLNTNHFASVPLLARDKALGVLLVDNVFNRKPITESDLNFLVMFANQAGLAIESTRLYSYLEETNEELKRTQQRLVESEKLAALGEMAAGVAHEIRNPLVSIGGFARRLQQKLNGTGTEAKYLNIIIREVKRLEKILQDVLYFSKESPLLLSKNNINEIIEDTLLFFESEAKEKNITIKVSLDKQIPPFLLDSQQIKQVLINLLTNSVQAIEKNGKLDIKSFLKNNNSVAGVEITDTGGGIPVDVLDNIFNPFFTTKNTGTGLGLALTRKIVEKHGGQIKIRNKIGEGVTFEIDLPIDSIDSQDKPFEV